MLLATRLIIITNSIKYNLKFLFKLFTKWIPQGWMFLIDEQNIRNNIELLLHIKNFITKYKLLKINQNCGWYKPKLKNQSEYF